MAGFDLVRTPAELESLLAYIGRTAPKRIAVDIEGENNLHAYGIHVALIQLFDGTRAFVIDAPAIRSRELYRALLEDSPWLKVMFDATSDMLAFQHSLGVRPRPVQDLALAARMLGRTGGLDTFVHGEAPKRSKSRLQRSNWLRRPLTRELLEYAVSDVRPLLGLADALMAELEREGLMPEFAKRSSEIERKKLVWNPLANYTRIPGFNRLGRTTQEFAKVLWMAREYYARKRNVPPDTIATKIQLRRIIEENLRDPSRIAHFLNSERRRQPLDPQELGELLREAEKDAARGGTERR
jgi:ribonuclease D